MCGALRAEPEALDACWVLSSSLLKCKESRLHHHFLSSHQWICVSSGSSVFKWRPVLSGCVMRHFFLRFKCDLWNSEINTYVLLKPHYEKLYRISCCEKGLMAPEQWTSSQCFHLVRDPPELSSYAGGSHPGELAPEIFLVHSSSSQQISHTDLWHIRDQNSSWSNF